MSDENSEYPQQYNRWTDADSAKAEVQGWNLFDYDNRGLLQIQRVDEAEAFNTDQEALDFIKDRASQDDETAKLALELDAFFEPIIYPEQAASGPKM
jgi:hypothetical protein